MPLSQHRPALAAILVAIAVYFSAYSVASAREADSDSESVSAAASVTNPVVATALGYLGTWQGECWPWVQRVVLEATGHQIGFDYREGFFEAGAIEVSIADASPGDIIQTADDSYTAPDADYDGLHTAIILANLGGGLFRVIDSNSQWDGVVRIREVYDPAASAARYGIQFHIYRIGEQSDVPAEARHPAPPLTAIATTFLPGDAAVVSAGGDCLNLRIQPGVGQAIITCLEDRTRVTVIGESKTVAGRVWVNISTPSGDGWAAAEFLAKVSAPAAGAGAGETRPLLPFKTVIAFIAAE